MSDSKGYSPFPARVGASLTKETSRAHNGSTKLKARVGSLPFSSLKCKPHPKAGRPALQPGP